MRRPNRDYYDAFAPNYERERHHGYHALIDELEVRIARRYADDAQVLEAGCGTGMILKEIAPRAKQAVGLDISPGMLRTARARGLDVVHGSVTDLPFADAAFDLCYSFKVLAHVEKIQRALSEMARVVRPGGHVIAEFYNPWSLRYLIKRLKRPTAVSHLDHDEAVYTRYDSLRTVRGYLPPDLELQSVEGVRVVTPVSHVHRVPILRDAFAHAERFASRAPGLRHLGGFMVVVARKQ